MTAVSGKLISLVARLKMDTAAAQAARGIVPILPTQVAPTKVATGSAAKAAKVYRRKSAVNNKSRFMCRPGHAGANGL